MIDDVINNIKSFKNNGYIRNINMNVKQICICIKICIIYR